MSKAVSVISGVLCLLCAACSSAMAQESQAGEKNSSKIHMIIERMPAEAPMSNSASSSKNVVRRVDCGSPDENGVIICYEQEVFHE